MTDLIILTMGCAPLIANRWLLRLRLFVQGCVLIKILFVFNQLYGRKSVPQRGRHT